MAIYNWRYNGTLKNIEFNTNKGVYLLIFKGIPKRIIYVGTSNCFIKRLDQHKQGYLNGNRTIWRANSSDDIYELMSCQGSNSKKRRFKYYSTLAKNGLLWAHTTLEKNTIENDLYKRDNFDENWKDFAVNNFTNNIEIWTCSMIDTDDRILALESRIQRAFKKNYIIESHINNHGMCFLGKIEYTGDISEYTFEFNILPDLDEISTRLLRVLPDKKVIQYYKQSYLRKKNKGTADVDKIRLEYKFSFTKWDSKEDDILYTCCKLGVLPEVISKEFLQRTIGEVNGRIRYLSRYYDFSKKT